MNLMTRWNTRQSALNVIRFFLSGTGVVLALAVIRARRWAAYGCAVYGRECATQIQLGSSPTWFFIKESLLPLILWLLVANVADRFIIRPITEKIFE